MSLRLACILLSCLFYSVGSAQSQQGAETDHLDPQTGFNEVDSPLPNRVNGNLILFNDNGAWSWYQDERAIVDPRAGQLLVSSVAASMPGVDGPRDGNVDLTAFDFATGQRSRFVLSEIEEDDHNLAALLTRPDGRYLAVYANHNSDYVTRYRVSTNPGDASEWRPERTFDWRDTPGNDFNVTYSNLLYLSAENLVYNFARATDRSPNMMLSEDQGDTWTYGGQLTRSQDVGYVNGYFKYASNGVDRIHMIATEAHPRDYNNGIYHAYIEASALYGSDGTLIDSDIHDNQNIPAIRSLTPIFIPDREDGAQQRHRGWTTDLALDPHGLPYALFTTRAGDAVPSSNGKSDDRRLYYARFDGKQWRYHEVAKMGVRLFQSEQDYTGLGALVPGDPDTIFVSTTYDPTTGEETPYHEIYKGKTQNAGQSWRWTRVTEASTCDNLRPIVPRWDGDNLAVLWFRGRMIRSQAYDAAVVGLVERQREKVGAVHYVDANRRNTRIWDHESNAVGNFRAEDKVGLQGWTEKYDLGNEGNIWTFDPAECAGPAPLATELTGLPAGVYDLFAYFWANPEIDSEFNAGISRDGLLAFGAVNTQTAEPEQVESTADLVCRSREHVLHRGYLGRVNIEEGGKVTVFIDGHQASSGDAETMYDGVGYARVTRIGAPETSQ